MQEPFTYRTRTVRKYSAEMAPKRRRERKEELEAALDHCRSLWPRLLPPPRPSTLGAPGRVGRVGRVEAGSPAALPVGTCDGRPRHRSCVRFNVLGYQARRKEKEPLQLKVAPSFAPKSKSKSVREAWNLPMAAFYCR